MIQENICTDNKWLAPIKLMSIAEIIREYGNKHSITIELTDEDIVNDLLDRYNEIFNGK